MVLPQFRRDDAVVTAVSVAGNFIVTFGSYGNQQEVELGNIRQPMGGEAAEGAGATAYRGKQKRERVR